MKKAAVITGDIINFTQLGDNQRKKVIEETDQLLKSWTSKKSNAEVFRGDSYQVLFEEPAMAVTKGLQLIAWFKKHSTHDDSVHLGTRLSVGIGEVSYHGKNVLNSDGEAFHLSGRKFDAMTSEEYISIQSNNQESNAAIEIILKFVNRYISNWNRGQAEVIFWHLEGKTQQEIAKTLSISQPSVNSRLKTAGWKELEPTIIYLESLVK
ncbi:MAG: hypothetical protein V4687_18050 [Bacteroidota bacterium]